MKSINEREKGSGGTVQKIKTGVQRCFLITSDWGYKGWAKLPTLQSNAHTSTLIQIYISNLRFWLPCQEHTRSELQLRSSASTVTLQEEREEFMFSARRIQNTNKSKLDLIPLDMLRHMPLHAYGMKKKHLLSIGFQEFP